MVEEVKSYQTVMENDEFQLPAMQIIIALFATFGILGFKRTEQNEC